MLFTAKVAKKKCFFFCLFLFYNKDQTFGDRIKMYELKHKPKKKTKTFEKKSENH